MWLRIPRFGEVPEPEGGKHPARTTYLEAHAHPDRGHPFSWARPLRNMNVFNTYGGMDVDLFAARLEADINESPDTDDRGQEP
jgi:hypothetical protein